MPFKNVQPQTPRGRDCLKLAQNVHTEGNVGQPSLALHLEVGSIFSTEAFFQMEKVLLCQPVSYFYW